MARSKAKRRAAALKRAMTAPKGLNPFSVFSVPQQVSRRKRAPRKRKQAKMPASMPFAGQAAAAAYSRGQRSGEPRFLQRTARGTRIVHRELVGSVTGSASFTVQSTFALNPGLANTFPWLSTQAVGWEQYKFHKLKFCYYTRTATSTPGSMMLVPDYDAADAAPSTEQIASSYKDVVEEVPWTVEFSCDLDTIALMEPSNRKFIRTGVLAANLDVKTYDGGNFFVCTTDGTAVNWGKLWVEYDVEFFVPQLPPQGAGLNASAKVVGSGSISATSYFGSAPTVTGGLSVTASAMVLTFNQEGQYQVVLSLGGTTLMVPVSSGSTATVTEPSNGWSAGSALTALQATFLVTVTAVGQTLVLLDEGSSTVTSSVTRISPYLVSLG